MPKSSETVRKVEKITDEKRTFEEKMPSSDRHLVSRRIRTKRFELAKRRRKGAGKLVVFQRQKPQT